MGQLRIDEIPTIAPAVPWQVQVSETIENTLIAMQANLNNFFVQTQVVPRPVKEWTWYVKVACDFIQDLVQVVIVVAKVLCGARDVRI